MTSATTALLEFATDGSAPLPEDANAVIKGLIYGASTGAIVGPSGVGKTSVAIYLCFHVALGKKFHGRRVRPGAVLYVGYEGVSGLQNRMSAAFRKYGDPGKLLARLVLTPTLNKTQEGQKGAQQIVEAARELKRQSGRDVVLIVIDTKARATAGDEEDKASDAAHFLEHRLAFIARETGAAVCYVHHTGKDADRGGRGSSAMPAGDDWRLIVSADRDVKIDKARDDASGMNLFSYDLEPVELRRDTDGDPVTACTIKVRDKRNGTSLRMPVQRALDVLRRLVDDGRTDEVAQSDLGLEEVAGATMTVVVREEWRRACREKQLAEVSNPKSEGAAFRRAVETLEKDGYIARYGDYVWLNPQPGGNRQQQATDGNAGCSDTPM